MHYFWRKDPSDMNGHDTGTNKGIALKVFKDEEFLNWESMKRKWINAPASTVVGLD